MNDKWYNSDFASSVGIGIMWCLVGIGFGSCQHLTNTYDQIKDSPPEHIEK